MGRCVGGIESIARREDRSRKREGERCTIASTSHSIHRSRVCLSRTVDTASASGSGGGGVGGDSHGRAPPPFLNNRERVCRGLGSCSPRGEDMPSVLEDRNERRERWRSEASYKSRACQRSRTGAGRRKEVHGMPHRCVSNWDSVHDHSRAADSPHRCRIQSRRSASVRPRARVAEMGRERLGR